ncbi:hypothetical protein [Ruegeria arenilitoris]|nr:hypothetical protein [Ruegeria arenilitoris]
MTEYELALHEKTAKEIDLDALAGDVSVCMQSPECTDSPTPNEPIG